MSKYLKRAINKFYSKKFKEALLDFSLALQDNDELADAKVGAMLCDLASEKEEEAIALFEYYIITKESGVEAPQESIIEIINTLEYDLEELTELLFNKELEKKIDEENGIAYEDFQAIIKEKESFKEAFEDIMFSTKVIIHNKDDFLDFIEKLLDNGFKEISLNYVESAITLFPNDDRLLSLIEKAQE